MSTPETSYREIPLTKGQVALVDDNDALLVSGRKWTTFGARAHRYYARTGGPDGVAMHRLIMGLARGDRREVDHINGNTLDNRRHNLRICDHRENVRNRRLGRDNTSGYKGVTFSKGKGKWQAQIAFDGRRRHLGYFSDPQIAHAAYCASARELHGEFARAK
jgi:hypothetical protein